MALPPRLARYSHDPTATPNPTPPSSTSSIPLCFPSPTSVAHVLNHLAAPATAPNGSGVADPPRKDPVIARHHPESDRRPLSPNRPQPPHVASNPPPSDPDPVPLPPPPPPPPPFFYHFPHLTCRSPTPPSPPVTKTQFVTVLDQFLHAEPSIEDAPPVVLVARIRRLLDHLDALVEQLSLRVTNALFDALSHPKCLQLLMFLLSDVSATSSPIVTDVRKSYRYPYLVANILANGTMVIRDAFLSSTDLVSYLLSFLDGHVVLSTAPSAHPPSTQPSDSLSYARDNPIIVGNVVQILVSYMETSPETLLKVFRNRPTFIPSLVNLLHIGSVPQLLNCLIPDRCVDDLTSVDPHKVSFDTPIAWALAVLADGFILHHLVNAFVEAAQTIYTATSHPNPDTLNRIDLHNAQQIAFNIIHVYGTVILKSIRAVRLKPQHKPCQYLNIFGNPASAITVSVCLQAGIDLFLETQGQEVSILKHALELTINLLQYLNKDKEKRVASVQGQPQMLDTSALEDQLGPLIKPLAGVLIDTVETGAKHGQIRIQILDLFMGCQSVCSERLVDCFNDARLGEIALRVMLMNPHNSIMQNIISRAVESALITNHRSGAYAHHWLVKSRLMSKIMKTWRRDGGDEIWKNPGRAQKAPYLSALLHMACCVQHWIAIQRDSDGCTDGVIGNGDPVRKVIADEIVRDFEEFCKKSVDGIMKTEGGYLGGVKPPRRGSRAGGNSFGRSFGSFGTTSAAVLRRGASTSGVGGNGENRAHLVRSPSAHRFGYVAPPVISTRSRLDEMFIEDDLTEGGAFGTTDLRTSFSSIFDAEPDQGL